MNEAHTTKYSVHSGSDKMHYDKRDLFWWPGMKKDIVIYVSMCSTCSKVMAEHQKPSVLQQQPKILEWKWEKITMDFVTKFPKDVNSGVFCEDMLKGAQFGAKTKIFEDHYFLTTYAYTGTQQIHTAYSNQLDTAYMSSDTETVDEEITMAEPNDYISATQKNFVSNDNVGRMVEKSIVEIQGTFLVKIRKNAFNGNIGENAFKHIDKFLDVVEAIKINGLNQDRFRLSVLPVSLAGATSEWFTKEYLFTFKIQGTKAYEEYESNNHMKGDPEETMVQKTWVPIPTMNYEASNAGDTQDNQGHKERRDNPTHEPSS
ncbi:putative reverse transcriptase domain-containing protein [Tanacetum coccineum]